MTKRIFRNIFLVAFLTLISSMVLFMGVLHHYFKKQINKELENQAVYIAQGIEHENAEYFDNLSETNNRITWIDGDGNVLFDNEADVADMENHGDREEFLEAKTNGRGTSVRYSETLSEKNTYYAILLENGSVLRVSSTQRTIWSLTFGMIQPIALIVVLAAILSAVFANRMAKRIVKPINEINLTNPEENETYDELSPLLTKINKLMKEIEIQIEDAKRKQHEFTMITENMSEGLIITDNKTDILSYNTSAYKLFDMEDEIKNKSVLTLNRSSRFRDAVELAQNGQHNDQILDIGNRYYHLFANPVYHENDFSGIVIIIMDITEKEQRDVLRREFTSNVSHELKTPLTGIYGTSEIIANGLVKEEDIPEFANNIHKEAGRLMVLIDEIMKLSQLDENKLLEQKTAVDLYEISESVISHLKEEADKKHISLELKGSHVRINGIRRMIEEMIYNLCDNAIKYNSEHGSVCIWITEDGEQVKLSVADTGIGIPLADQDRIFERFYRVDKSHSKDVGGTGLGLSIVKHYAAYHEASVTLDSVLNQGTIITICWNKK